VKENINTETEDSKHHQQGVLRSETPINPADGQARGVKKKWDNKSEPAPMKRTQGGREDPRWTTVTGGKRKFRRRGEEKRSQNAKP